MHDHDSITRRRFIGTVASAAAVTIVPRHVLGRGVQAPSDTLNIAGIGIGGRGRADVRGCAGENIVALCDVDAGHAAPVFREYPAAARYTDYRRMLDREPDLDAVIIATPDHTHAVIAMEAMRRGKHVYCEKPLTRTVAEARALADMARAQGVVTQMGNQGHAGEGTRQIREWIGADMYGRTPRLFPARLHDDVMASPPPPTYPRSPGVFLEWIDAIKGRGATGSSFPGHAGPLTEVVLLGNLAVRTGQPIEWDGARMRVSNVPEANALLDEEYRKGWSL